MTEYTVSKFFPSDKTGNEKIDELLNAEGIRRDGNLDYTCAIYDDEMNVIATGSCYENTLRCMAVSRDYQGEGLMNIIVTHLMEVEHSRGNSHLFLYTKCESAKFFGDLGFSEIARIENRLVFMENRKHGFSQYLSQLKTSSPNISVDKNITVSGLVMNANPFTLGHLYLVEKAASESTLLHLFIVSEDASLIPFKVRRQLVLDGTAHIKNICYHDSGPYIISNATFPSYFQNDSTDIITGHAMLDLTIFLKIASSLGITRRYVGEEPNSQVTGIYNQIMQEKLTGAGIDCLIIPRKQSAGAPISASTVRTSIKNNDYELLKLLVPQTTFDYFMSDAADDIVKKIQTTENVIHY